MAQDLAQFQNPRFARFYLKISANADRRGAAEHRRRLLAGLTGRVLEVGAGQGRNFPHYPPEVDEVVAVEPEALLRAQAEQTAATAPVPVTVLAGHADALPAQDSSLDAVVYCLVLCSVPDPARSLAEAARILRPGGQLRFYEHVRSHGRIRALLQDAITPIWTRQAAGCHPNRDTAAAIRTAGFHIDEMDQFGFSFSGLVPPMRHILGRATR